MNKQQQRAAATAAFKMDVDDKEDEDGPASSVAGEQAYAAILATLRETTSEHLGTGTLTRTVPPAGSRSGSRTKGTQQRQASPFPARGARDAANSTTPLFYDDNDIDGLGDDDDSIVDVAADDDEYDHDHYRYYQEQAAAAAAYGASIKPTMTTTPMKKRDGTTTTAAVLARAQTPIMSNESKKKAAATAAAAAAAASLSARTVDRSIAFNVESPYVSEQLQQDPYDSYYSEPQEDEAQCDDSNTRTPRPAIIARSKPSAKSLSHVECKLYHDALYHYLLHKRRWLERWQQQQQQAAAAVPVEVEALRRDEVRLEVEFLQALQHIAWDRSLAPTTTTTTQPWSTQRKEGNFWLLLASLRKLGVDALAYDQDEEDDDENSNDMMNRMSPQQAAWMNYRQELAQRVHATPRELIQATTQLHHQPSAASECPLPLLLRRRRCILQWLETCFAPDVPSDATRPRTLARVIPSSRKLAQQGLPETDKDSDLMRASLALFLAGRHEDILTLMRQSGVPWRAASWGGEAPHGYQVSTTQTKDPDDGKSRLVSVGNPARALWRWAMWQQSEHLQKNPAKQEEEAAMVALLSNHVQHGLDNACLRTWEKGLYVSLRALVGRMEDELLHEHNEHRRQLQPPFPGTQYGCKEREQLKATDNWANMNEYKIIHMLRAAPFDEMHASDPYSMATEAFIMGIKHVNDFVERAVVTSTSNNDSNYGPAEEDEVLLRFVTHLVFYLDSLSAGSTPVHIGVATMEFKEQILLRYLNYLASREDLWYLMVLYASLLSVSTVNEHFPPLLTVIESMEERKVIVEQLGTLMQLEKQDLIILRQVVTMILSESDPDPPDPDTPTSMDIRKMKSILWLSLVEDHMEDALILSNTMLRQFMLLDKESSALLFLDDILPHDIFRTVAMNDEPEEEESVSIDVNLRKQACSEHMAFRSYLDAVRALLRWRDVVISTDPRPSVVDDRLDTSRLNAMETEIAASIERRDLMEEKRRLSKIVVDAADAALKGLQRVLEHPGGWLLAEDGDDLDRSKELLTLRGKLLPYAVMNYYEICKETARWMSYSLNDAVERLGGGDARAMLSALDEACDGANTPLSPRFWTQQALDLAQSVVSDNYNVKATFSPEALQVLLAKFAEATIDDLDFSE